MARNTMSCVVLCLGKQSCFMMVGVVIEDVGIEENIFLRTLIQGTIKDISNCEAFNEFF